MAISSGSNPSTKNSSKTSRSGRGQRAAARRISASSSCRATTSSGRVSGGGHLVAALEVRGIHDDLPVEAAGAEQGAVEDSGLVGGSQQDDAGIGLEAVHFHQQGVEGLLALVVDGAAGDAALAADGVHLVNEDDAGGVFLGLFEEVTHAGGADADEHFDKIRTA